MGKIILTESQLKKLIEQGSNSVAMDLDIYNQEMTTPTGRPTMETEETVEMAIEKLEELLSMMKGGKNVHPTLRQRLAKTLDDLTKIQHDIKYNQELTN